VPAEEVLEFDGPEFLFGGYKRLTKQDCLAALAPRPLVDKLVVKCFDSVDIAHGMSNLLQSFLAPMLRRVVTIHRLTFMKEVNTLFALY
jgi:hypothetical protein